MDNPLLTGQSGDGSGDNEVPDPVRVAYAEDWVEVLSPYDPDGDLASVVVDVGTAWFVTYDERLRALSIPAEHEDKLPGTYLITITLTDSYANSEETAVILEIYCPETDLSC